MSSDLFSMVGCRFSELTITEQPVQAAEDKKLRLHVIVGIQPHRISKTALKGREVIELRVNMIVRVGTGETSNDAPERTAEDVVFAECVAGFVGRDAALDGNLEMFSRSADDFSRAVYWVARQRVAGVLTSTMFTKVQLPWDFGEIEEREAVSD